MKESRIILKNVGKYNPVKLEDYLKTGGFSSVRLALTQSPDDLINSIIDSGLRGRGGAGFPTGLKFKYTRNATSPDGQKYLICNADEGEPGTFKDKYIMENDPYLLIESMIIAAYCIQATKAFIYIRAEYYKSIQLLQNAIKSCKNAGYLGDTIFNSNFSLSIELKLGAGSYLCGEELTLIESLEGKRGHPRIKPPFPAEKGLYQRPTLVNNVETLVNLPEIISQGVAWFKSYGVNSSPGTKIFCLSGDINRPGVYELPLGTSLRTIVYGYGGGISGDSEFKGALLGGAAGTFTDDSNLDIALDYDSLANANLSLGSGAIIVFNQMRNITKLLANILRFFKHESCGKCIPCRVGTTNLVSQFEEISKSENIEKSLELMIREAKFIKATSLCPLGQSPILPLSSAIKYFKSEFNEIKP